MTATIELNDRAVKRAEKLSGITDVQELVKMAINRYLKGQSIRAAALEAQKEIGDENPFWEDYDPKA
jgi:hypothetical protein